MTSVRGRGRPRRERPSIAFPDSFPPPESEFSEQPDGPPGPKSPAAATHVPKYSEDDLQRILKAVLEAQAPAPATAPATSEETQNKPLKARSPDVYRGKSHMDC